MSFIPPSSADVGSLMALVAVVSDPKKSTAILEAIKAETDKASEAHERSVTALAELQQEQRAIIDLRKEAENLKAAADKSISASDKREQELNAAEAALKKKLELVEAESKAVKADRAALDKALKDFDAEKELHKKNVAALEADKAANAALMAEKERGLEDLQKQLSSILIARKE